MIIYLHLGIHNSFSIPWIFTGTKFYSRECLGEKQMKGDFDIYHSKYFLFLQKKWSFTVVWGFQLSSELSEEYCLRMELVFPKLGMFHSLFLYHPQLKMNKNSGIQTLSFCGPLCCSGGNCPFLLSRCTWRYKGVLQSWRRWLLGARYLKQGRTGLSMFLSCLL